MSILRIALFVALACAWSDAQIINPPKVTIPGLGEVVGKKNWNTQWTEQQIFYFLGIPFGKAPVGDLRFKPSLPAEPWEGTTYDATKFGRLCIQSGTAPEKEGHSNDFWGSIYKNLTKNVPEDLLPDLENKVDEGPEDCLNLNIFTTNLNPEKPLPVMVFFHGGAFFSGSSYIYWPHFLLDHGDIILVVPHYRLGPLGFLSMQNDEIPGNAGLFDQKLALEWVQNYISYFGGDPNEVTAFGESAGAASVSLLATSPHTKHLFKRIIAESGSAITEWAIDRDPVFNARGVASYLAEKGCDTSSDESITRCFMTMDPYDITGAYGDRWKADEMKNGRTGFGGCSPVVQTTGEIKLIEKMPIEYWREEGFTTVPGMYGANKHEGSYVMAIVYDGYLRANDLLEDTDFIKYDSVRVFLDLFLIEDPAYVLHDALEMEYVGIDRMGNITAMIPGMVDFSGATFLKGPSFEQTKMHAKFGNSYWYAFNFFDRVTLWPFVGSFDVPFGGGVTHANDLIFIFNIPGMGVLMSDKEYEMAKIMSKVWYNFGKYGETTPEESPVNGMEHWPPYNPVDDTYMRFDHNFETLTKLLSNFPSEYTLAKDEDFAL